MKNQNILALWLLKPARRVTKSVGISIVLMLTAAVIAMVTPSSVSASSPCGGPTATRLVTGLQGAMGSTVGPDGALYVTEGAAIGTISRVDPQTGEKTTFASSTPPCPSSAWVGAMSVAFIDNIAYALVTLVSPDVGGSDVDGIYRIRPPGPSFTSSLTLVRSTWPIHRPLLLTSRPVSVRAANLPWRLPGRRFAPQPRARVTLDGDISVLIAFDNIVPTGLKVKAIRCTWPRPAPTPTRPKPAKLCRSGRGRPPLRT